jgi:hypothetical protein
MKAASGKRRGEWAQRMEKERRTWRDRPEL